MHVFEKPRHGLMELITKMDISKENLVDMVVRRLIATHPLPFAGEFKRLDIDIAGHTIRIGGCVHDGIVKVGTFFIPDR